MNKQMEPKEIIVKLGIKPNSEFNKKLKMTFLDYVLHSTSQIPFTTEMFTKFVDKMSTNELRKKNFRYQKQLKQASECLEKITFMKQTIESESEGIIGDPLLVLLGPTIFTAKLCFYIKTPQDVSQKSISPTLVDENIRQSLLQMIQHKHFQDLKPPSGLTNTFLLFRNINSNGPHFSELRNFKVPKSCSLYKIEFKVSTFDIFEDSFMNLKIEEDINVDDVTDIVSGRWYQSKVFVKGFSDIVNDKSIWT